MIQNQGLAVLLDKDTGLLKSIGVVRPDGITMIKVRVNKYYMQSHRRLHCHFWMFSIFCHYDINILIKLFLPEGEPNVSVVRRNERK